MNTKNVLIVSLAAVAVIGGLIYLFTGKDAYGRPLFKLGGDMNNVFGNANSKNDQSNG